MCIRDSTHTHTHTHTEHALSLPLSLSHTHTHTHTHSRSSRNKLIRFLEAGKIDLQHRHVSSDSCRTCNMNRQLVGQFSLRGASPPDHAGLKHSAHCPRSAHAPDSLRRPRRTPLSAAAYWSEPCPQNWSLPTLINTSSKHMKGSKERYLLGQNTTCEFSGSSPLSGYKVKGITPGFDLVLER